MYVPKPEVIGGFPRGAHDITSGDVILINEKTLVVKDLTYDGRGPGA